MNNKQMTLQEIRENLHIYTTKVKEYKEQQLEFLKKIREEYSDRDKDKEMNEYEILRSETFRKFKEISKMRAEEESFVKYWQMVQIMAISERNLTLEQYLNS